MADPAIPGPLTPPSPPPAVDPTAHAITPGLQTTEGKAALVGMILATIGTVGPIFVATLTELGKSYPQTPILATAASVASIVVAAIVARGYGAQRTAIKVAALGQGGYVRVLVACATALLCGSLILAVAGCASLQKASGSSGDVDLGHGWVCKIAAAPIDPATCLKISSLSCQVPLTKAKDGSCPLSNLDLNVPADVGSAAKCVVAAGAGLAPCTATVELQCTSKVTGADGGPCAGG